MLTLSLIIAFIYPINAILDTNSGALHLWNFDYTDDSTMLSTLFNTLYSSNDISEHNDTLLEKFAFPMCVKSLTMCPNQILNSGAIYIGRSSM